MACCPIFWTGVYLTASLAPGLLNAQDATDGVRRITTLAISDINANFQGGRLVATCEREWCKRARSCVS